MIKVIKPPTQVSFDKSVIAIEVHNAYAEKMKQIIIFIVLANVICICSYKKNLRFADINDYEISQISPIGEVKNGELGEKLVDEDLVGSGDNIPQDLEIISEETEKKPDKVKTKPGQWSCKEKAKEGYKCLSASVCPAWRDEIDYTCKYPGKVCCNMGAIDD